MPRTHALRTAPARPAESNGAAGGAAVLLRRRRRQGRVVLLVVGVALLGAALTGFELLVPQAPHSRLVLVAAGPIRAGQVIGAGDLRAVTIASAEVTGLAVGERDRVVGLTAAFDVAAGQPLVEADVGGRPGPALAHEVVGALLGAGRFPDGLAVGDTVMVLDTPGTSGPGSAGPAGAAVPAAGTGSSVSGGVVELGLGKVMTVAASSDGTHTKVSLEVASAGADAVAAASASDAVSLAWVPR